MDDGHIKEGAPFNGGAAWPPTHTLSAGFGLKAVVLALIAAAAFLFVSNATSPAGTTGDASTTESRSNESAQAQPAQPEQTADTQIRASTLAPAKAPATDQLTIGDVADSDPNALAPPGTETTWVGTIDDKIDFTLVLEQDRDIVFGYLTYTSANIAIRVIGQQVTDQPSNYFLTEYTPTGDSTGGLYLGGVHHGQVDTASWGELGAVLHKTGEKLTTTSPAAVAAGEFRYNFGDGHEYSGALTVSDVSTSTVTVSIHAVGAGPAFNQAITGDVVLTLEGNRGTWDSPADDPRCSFSVVFFDGFVFVAQVDPFDSCRADSGYGNNTTVIGAYIDSSGQNV